MKIKINKKKIIGSIIIFVIMLTLILIKYKTFYNDNSFKFIPFIVSIFVSILSSALFSIQIDANDRFNKILTLIIFVISILFTYIIVELLNQNVLFALYRKRLIFNFVLITFLHLFIYAISNRIKASVIIVNTLVFILGLVNYTVTCFRGTPFVPWDILSIKTAAHVAGTYKFEINYFLITAISLFTFIISLSLNANYIFKNKKTNYIVRFLLLIIIISSILVFYNINFIDYIDFENNLWKPVDEYHNNGFLASFIKQSKNLFNEKPEGYSIVAVKSAMKKNISTNEVTSDKPNIIVIMNESFADLSVNGNLKTSENYLKYFKSLKENTIRGNVYVSVFGGQTPNSEWEFLTNNTMAFMPYRTVPYQQYIRHRSYSLATTLKSQGYTANAIHPWYGSGYRRNAIYPLLGFDSFESIETLKNLEYLRTYPTDLSIYKYITNQFDKKNQNDKIFDFVVTMQNHSGYDIPGMESTVFLKNMEHFPRVEQYLTLIKKSDDALKYLINYFKNYNEKTIILFFGDHQPPYFEDEFWDTLMKDSTDEISKYITPFIIWANYDIEEKEVNKISLNYLSTLLLDTANLKTTPYMNFTKQIQESLPVITGNGYIDSTGNSYTFEDETQYSDLLKQYQIIQYNNVFDYKNTVKEFFEITQ